MAPRRTGGRTMIEVGVVGGGGQDRPNQIVAQPSEQFRPSECALSPLLSRITNFFLRPALASNELEGVRRKVIVSLEAKPTSCKTIEPCTVFGASYSSVNIITMSHHGCLVVYPFPELPLWYCGPVPSLARPLDPI